MYNTEQLNEKIILLDGRLSYMERKGSFFKNSILLLSGIVIGYIASLWYPNIQNTETLYGRVSQTKENISISKDYNLSNTDKGIKIYSAMAISDTIIGGLKTKKENYLKRHPAHFIDSTDTNNFLENPLSDIEDISVVEEEELVIKNRVAEVIPIKSSTRKVKYTSTPIDVDKNLNESLYGLKNIQPLDATKIDINISNQQIKEK